MRRTIPVLLSTVAAVVPVSGAFLGTPAHAAVSTTTTHKVAAKPKVTTRTIKGPNVDMRWGTVQVTLIVKGKKITDVRTVAPTERSRSAFINEQAVPMLRQEVLQVQKANIDLISGATMTSEAFVMSLQAAIKTAKL